MTEHTHHVFVYGTLKQGHGNNRLLRTAAFVGRGETVKPFQMRSTGGFPVVFDTNDGERASIAGEVYEVHDEHMHHMDQLEGHPDWYRRQEVVVDVSDTGIQQTCWMYVGTPGGWGDRRDSLPLVPLNSRKAFEWGRRA